MLLSNLLLTLKMFSVNRSSQNIDTTVEIVAVPEGTEMWVLCGCIFLLACLVGTLIFVAVSWHKITLWRQFKNYIFLNITITLILLDASEIVYCIVLPASYKHIVDLVYNFAFAAFANWLLIMCIVIYTKIVKVFSGTLQHKYLKANAFAWGLAVIESIISTYVLCPSLVYTLHLMTYVILGFYLSILYALVKLTLVRMVSHDNNFQILRIFVYVTSAFTILIMLQIIEYCAEYSDGLFLGILAMQFILIVAFLSMKSHREMWDEFLKRNNRDVLYMSH